MPKVTFIYGDTKKIVNTQAGKTILECAGAEHKISAVCGGKKTCGKCRVLARGGLSAISQEEARFLSSADREQGVRLSCMAKVMEDAEIIISSNGTFTVETDYCTEKIKFRSGLEIMDLAVPLAPLGKTDSTCLLDVLCKKKVDVSTGVLRQLQKILREQDYRVTVVIDRNTVIAILPCDMPVVGMAVDIGTTTVAAYYYDMRNGKRIAVQSGQNAQFIFGADVISRIGHMIEKKEGLDELQHAIVEQLNAMTAAVCPTACVVSAVLTGNTVMEHLVTGISPQYIASAPFTPAWDFGMPISFSEIGLLGSGGAKVYLSPCAAGYVGGDIVTGIFASGMAEKEELALFIDIGTNGEIALGSKAGIFCCAAAAGPAFEGAHIERGCGGISGAVDSVFVTKEGYTYTTIGGKAPVGICGSGLIDVLAAMIETGVCDETGRILDRDEVDEIYIDFLEEDDNGNVFYLDRKQQLYITQKDVRELQLAKAAIAAGINTLLRELGKTTEEIKTVYLCGGFGAHIRKESAAFVGLLPKQKIEATKILGNAAGAGAVAALLNSRTKLRLEKIKQKMHYIELSGSTIFMEEYVEQMMF